MAKFTKYLTSLLIYIIATFVLGMIMGLLMPATGFVTFLQIVISLGIIYLIVRRRGLQVKKKA